MSKEWKRNEKVEQAFEDMHKLKPVVEYRRENSNKYKVRLKHKSKEVILSEELERGLTKEATLEYDGKTESFKRYCDAEKRACEILRS